MDLIRKKIKLILILVTVIFIGFFIYNSLSGGKSKKIEISQVENGTLEEKMTISGVIDAEEKATLRFQTSGRLNWVGVREGDHVKKYQGIASLDQREVKKKLQKELNDYMTSRWDFEQKHRDDYRDRAMTDTIKRILEKAQFDLNNTVLDVEIQNLSVEYSNLWTPIDGIVTRVSSPFAGVNIIPTQAEFDIVNPLTIYFSATADQSEVVKLKENMPGELILDPYPDTTISGKIKNISFIPKSGESSTVYEIKFVYPLDNDNFEYRLGMAGDLTFVTKRKEDVLYIPTKYIKNKNGKKYVTVKRSGKEQKIEITTGIETDTDTEITSGISSGETIYD